jgi:ankyrin repeat protein
MAGEYVHVFARASILTRRFTPPQSGRVPLHWAAFQGNTGAIAALLDLKGNVHAQDKVRCACMHSKASGMLSGAPTLPIPEPQDGATPLHWAAACESHTEAVAALIAAGADTGAKAKVRSRQRKGCVRQVLLPEAGARL